MIDPRERSGDAGLGLDPVAGETADRWRDHGLGGDWADDRPEWERGFRGEPQAVGDGVMVHCDRCEVMDAGRWCCCRRCSAAPRLPGSIPLCVECQLEILCRVCGMRAKSSRGRCDTCRKYFERTGRERPRHLITRSGDRPLTLAELDEVERRQGNSADPFR